MQLPEYIAKFLDYLKYEKGYSEHTITSYKTDLLCFSSYVFKKQISLSKIDALIIREWMSSLIQNKKSATTVKRRFSALSSFYKFLIRIDSVQKNPTQGLITPKIKKRLPQFLKKDELEQLFNHITFNNTFEEKRNELILLLFFYTGIRRSELINITFEDFVSNDLLKIFGKGKKERLIPLSEKLINKIDIFKQTYCISSKNNYLFCNEAGKPLYPKKVYLIVKKYLSLVTTMSKQSPHILRHSFATHMLNNGADINAIKEILGHTSLSATQVYTHNTIDKLKSVYKNAHPRA